MAKQKTVSVSEFKAKALAYFEEVNRSGSSILVTKRGKLTAVVASPDRQFRKEIKPNHLAHTIVEEGDIVSPLTEVEWDVLK